MHDSAQRYCDELGVDVFLGEGRFVDSNGVEVAGQQLHFRRAVIATGTRAMPLPIPGLAEVGYLTNETVFFLTELPKRLAIIGARLKKTSSVRLSAWRPSCSEWVAPLEQFSF